MENKKIVIKAEYGAIQSVRAMCAPWIDLYSGDRWGVGMGALWTASHTDQTFTHEVCAIFTSYLLDNLIYYRNWAIDNLQEGYAPPSEDVDRVREECRKIREYWLSGGNVGDRETALAAHEAMLNIPSWMYE